MIVDRYMHREAITALPSAPVSAVRDVMEKNGFGLLFVAASDGTLQGFVTRSSLKGVTDWDAPVERITHPARFAVSPSDTLEKAALILLENRLVLLPVTDEQRLVGVITQSEVLRGLAQGLGIGLEGTRLTVKIHDDVDDLYRVLEVLRERGVHLVSVTRDDRDEADRGAILRVQGVSDRDELRDELEARLRDAGCGN
jgi:acetoin utilization protein AcuB